MHWVFIKKSRAHKQVDEYIKTVETDRQIEIETSKKGGFQIENTKVGLRLSSCWGPHSKLLRGSLKLRLRLRLGPLLRVQTLLLGPGGGLPLGKVEGLADGADLRRVDGSSLGDLVGFNVLVVEENVDELPGRVTARGEVALAHVVASVGRGSDQRGPVVQLPSGTDFIWSQCWNWVPEYIQCIHPSMNFKTKKLIYFLKT